MVELAHPHLLPRVDEFSLFETSAQRYVAATHHAIRPGSELVVQPLQLHHGYRGYAFVPDRETPILAGKSPETRCDIEMRGRLILAPNGRDHLTEWYPDVVTQAIAAEASRTSIRLTFMGLQKRRHILGRISRQVGHWLLGEEPEISVHIRKVGGDRTEE